jgi:hypothetical protein
MSAIAHVIAQVATGAVVLFVSFSLLAGISPTEVAAAASAVAAVAALLLLRALRIDYELRTRGGDPMLRADRNRQRERRGF